MDLEQQSDMENSKKIMKAVKFKEWYDKKIKVQKPKRKCIYCGAMIAYMNMSKHHKSKKCQFVQSMIKQGYNVENPEN